MTSENRTPIWPPGSWAPWIVATLIIVLDQASKLYINQNFSLHQGVTVIPGFFDIVHIKNRGAAFGMLAGVDNIWVSVGFGVIAVVATLVLMRLYQTTPVDEFPSRFAFTIVASGAFGNLIDRIWQGSVTDFILVYYESYRWPAFNVADSCISVGVAILAWRILFHGEQDVEKP